MDTTWRWSWGSLFRGTRRLFWIVLVLIVLQQLCGPSRTAAARADLLDRLQQDRSSRVIAMIHRQDTVSLFGVPVSSSIGIEDSEAVLRAIRLTPPDQPIDLILHTPGGLVLAAEQIALALLERPGKVTVFVPHYAMSGGTLLALTADEIVMDPHAVLGPVDPQIGDMAASSIVKVLALKPPAQISDEMLVLADVAQKARAQVVHVRGRGPPEAHAEGARGRSGRCPERGAVDPRLSDYGRSGQAAGTARIDSDAAAHL